MEAAFDRLAPVYDGLWTNSAVGQLQREAFWRHVGPLFQAGDAALDLGCGTGEDAVILGQRGVRVVAIDSSPQMVRIARARGVDARVLPMEQLASIGRAFDGAISNFGALNCVARLTDIREPLGRLIRPGGPLAVCVMGRFCLWETLWYGLQGHFAKAARRWSGVSFPASDALSGLRVFYPTADDLRAALSPEFELIRMMGIGVCVPPSYVRGIPSAALQRLGRIDAAIAPCPGLRALADHRLLIFRRRR